MTNTQITVSEIVAISKIVSGIVGFEVVIELKETEFNGISYQKLISKDLIDKCSILVQSMFETFFIECSFFINNNTDVINFHFDCSYDYNERGNNGCRIGITKENTTGVYSINRKTVADGVFNKRLIQGELIKFTDKDDVNEIDISQCIVNEGNRFKSRFYQVRTNYVINTFKSRTEAIKQLNLLIEKYDLIEVK